MTQYHLLLTFIAASLMNDTQASPVLTQDLKLSIPYLRWQQNPTSSLGLSAELMPRVGEAGQLYFEVQSYALLPDTFQPPILATLADFVSGGSLQAVALDGTSVEIAFQSTVPIMCSVVYGTTTDFGQLATDPNMMTSASLNHQLRLADLQANTEYFYRVQGVDSQGTVYFSDIQSFVTGAEAAARPINVAALAQGARVTGVSSQFGSNDYNGAWGAHKALDGLSTTAWSSMGDGNDAFLVIELPVSQFIGQLGVWSRSMSDGSARIQTFTVTLDTGETVGPFTLPDAQRMYYFELNRHTQSLRFDVETSTGGNTGLIEFAAFLK